MIRVCIVDDHDIVIQGIKKLLLQTKDIQSICEFQSTKEFLEMDECPQIDVIILDLSFQSTYGDLSFIELIKNKYPSKPILVFSMLDEQFFGLEVLSYGVKGYVSKQEDTSVLIQAIRSVHSGQIYISKELSQILAQNYQNKTLTGSLESLSHREKEILVLLGNGLPLTEIAAKLFISIKTVSTYKRRILDKLLLKNQTDIIRFCMKNNLLH